MAFKWIKKKKNQPAALPADVAAPLSPAGSETAPAAATPVMGPTTTPADPPPIVPPKVSGGLFGRLKRGLSKTRKILTTDIDDLFSGHRKVNDALLEELEELLITSDLGVRTAMDLIQNISRKGSGIATAEDLKASLKQEIKSLLTAGPADTARIQATRPHVIMVVGVNGVGKTTTIGKLAFRFAATGQKVLIAAADTFRAAAVEQLAIWADRAGAEIVKHKANADPAAVAYDGIEAALARDCDIVIVDTAGRLHTKVNLMEELKKIKRSIAKKLPGAPHEVLLVLDATTGQNALSQAELFNESLDLNAIALTKLDGTAKGGIVVSICHSLKVPLRYIGIGEAVEDLQDFDPEKFVEALF